MKKWFVILLAISFSINAMQLDPAHFVPQPPDAGAGAGAAAADEAFVVDAAFIKSFLNDHFSEFLDAKKAQRETLTTVTQVPLFGRILSGGLEALGVVDDVEHAQTFLTRMFKDGPTEQAFREAADALADSADNVAYLQALFAKVDPAKVTQDEMKAAMKEVKHALVPNPSLMGNQGDDGAYTLSDANVHPWAACNMFAFYWIEQRDKQNRKPRGLKKGGSRLFRN